MGNKSKFWLNTFQAAYQVRFDLQMEAIACAIDAFFVLGTASGFALFNGRVDFEEGQGGRIVEAH